MSAAVRSRSSVVLARMASQSRAMSRAQAMSWGVARSAGSASRGTIRDQLTALSAAGGSPLPKWLVWYVQSTRLNQSPESKLLRSRDLDRRMSTPAWK